MTSNTDTQSESNSPDNHPDHVVPVEKLNRPGYLFDIEGNAFLTNGSQHTREIGVVRLDTGTTEELDRELLAEDIESDRFTLLGTYRKRSEVRINRLALATLIDYVADDVEQMPEHIPSDVQEAVETARETLQ